MQEFKQKQDRMVIRVHTCDIWRDRALFMEDERGMTLKIV